jgi:hypothetical protein
LISIMIRTFVPSLNASPAMPPLDANPDMSEIRKIGLPFKDLIR